MADKKPAAAPTDAAAKPKLPLVPILGAALGSAVLVGALMFFLMPKAAPADGDEAAEQSDEEAADAPKAETRYVEIKEPLVVNLSSGDAKYLQVRVQLGTRSDEGQKAIEAHMPALQNAFLVMLRQTTPEELAQPDVMATLQEEALAVANTLLESETGRKNAASAVVFTSFVKQ